MKAGVSFGLVLLANAAVQLGDEPLLVVYFVLLAQDVFLQPLHFIGRLETPLPGHLVSLAHPPGLLLEAHANALPFRLKHFELSEELLLLPLQSILLLNPGLAFISPRLTVCFFVCFFQEITKR